MVRIELGVGRKIITRSAVASRFKSAKREACLSPMASIDGDGRGRGSADPQRK